MFPGEYLLCPIATEEDSGWGGLHPVKADGPKAVYFLRWASFCVWNWLSADNFLEEEAWQGMKAMNDTRHGINTEPKSLSQDSHFQLSSSLETSLAKENTFLGLCRVKMDIWL